MRVSIRDKAALLKVAPEALAAYARSLGWSPVERYRVHSDVYACENLPEVVIPRRNDLGDYASVVMTLIDTFAEVAGQDESTVYRDLITANRDTIRFRAIDGNFSGSLPIDAGVTLVSCARDAVRAAACSLGKPRPVYSPETDQDAREYMSNVQLGQTELGGYVITLLGPVVSAPERTALERHLGTAEDPVERRVTKRLTDALTAVRNATDDLAGTVWQALPRSLAQGVSANLCEALATLADEFREFEISVSWAWTCPCDESPYSVKFFSRDASNLHEAARHFRTSSLKPVRASQFVGRVERVSHQAKR